MRKKGKKAMMVSMIVSAVLLVALMIAGTMLRMRTHELGFAQAFASFAADTFRLK